MLHLALLVLYVSKIAYLKTSLYVFMQIKIFTHNNYNNEVSILIDATEVRHLMACYLLGPIRLYSKFETDRENDHNMLRIPLFKLNMESIIKCRGIFTIMLKTIWIRNGSDMADKPPFICQNS